MKYFLICSLFMALVACSTEINEKTKNDRDGIKVDLSTYYESSRSFLALYPLEEMEDSLREKLVFPNLDGASDTTFAHVYFTGSNKEAVENVVTLLMTDCTSPNPKIWIDGDNDLRFTATDGPLLFEDDSVEISVYDMNHKHLKLNYRLYKLEDSIYAKRNAVISKYMTHGKHKIFFFDQRMDTKVGDFVYHGDSLRIGLKNWDANGAYIDQGKDRFVFGDYGKKIYGSEEFEGAKILDSLNYFGTDNFGFQVIEVAEDGSYLRLKVVEQDTTKTRFVKGDFLPDFNLTNLENESFNLYDNTDSVDYIYLNFWATWCSGCHTEMPYLTELHENYGDKIKMISVNFEEGPVAVQKFIDKYGVTWQSTLSTPEIIEALKVYGLPRNILLNNKGEIIDMNMHPSTFVKKLKAETSSKQGV